MEVASPHNNLPCNTGLVCCWTRYGISPKFVLNDHPMLLGNIANTIPGFMDVDLVDVNLCVFSDINQAITGEQDLAQETSKSCLIWLYQGYNWS